MSGSEVSGSGNTSPPGTRDREVVYESVSTFEEVGKKIPPLEGVPTGVPGLDELFFVSVMEQGKPRKNTLGGFPRLAVVNLTGVSDTGKSLMAEQYAMKCASRGEKVIFVTVESPAPFVAGGMKGRAPALGIEDSSVLDEHIIFVDAASYHKVREDIPTLLNTLAYVIRKYQTRHVVIDSITGLYEAREMMARVVVRQLFNFLKKWHQTAVFVSQKRSGHEELSAEAAGGYAVSHIVDCTIVLAKKYIASRYDVSLYGKPLGELIRLIRIDGCRLCGHDVSTRLLEIGEDGIVRVGPSLSELSSGSVSRKTASSRTKTTSAS